jgi:hypothetical protein
MAIGALRAARERGLRVPEELAVVGMDDIELSAYTDPPLTTVRIEKEAMGRLAADWLIALIEGTSAARAVAEVPIQLIVRGTCGGAATKAPTRAPRRRHDARIDQAGSGRRHAGAQGSHPARLARRTPHRGRGKGSGAGGPGEPEPLPALRPASPAQGGGARAEVRGGDRRAPRARRDVGTGALLVGLAALGVGPGDEVIVPTYTWVATINAVVTLGAVPVFVDIDESLTMDPRAVEAAITEATVAIVPVHMRGAAADIAPILAIAERRGLAVLEDAAQAVGGLYHGKRLGTFGKFGAFSLQYHKTITTGEGGLVVSDDTKMFERAVRYHDQGSVRVEELDQMIPDESPLIIGVNYRMSELTAAVGVAQLGKMDWIIGQQRAHKARAARGLAGIPGVRLRPLAGSRGRDRRDPHLLRAVDRRRHAIRRGALRREREGLGPVDERAARLLPLRPADRAPVPVQAPLRLGMPALQGQGDPEEGPVPADGRDPPARGAHRSAPAPRRVGRGRHRDRGRQGRRRDPVNAPEIGIGLLGPAGIGQAHAHAYTLVRQVLWPPPAVPRLVRVSGRQLAKAELTRARYGFERAGERWQELVEDPAVQALDNCAPNHLHLEPSLAAIRAGKHVFCEKPLGRTAAEARTLRDAAVRAGIVHMVGFNYRFVPAVAFTRRLIDEGRLGRIHHFRARFADASFLDPEAPFTWHQDAEASGSNALLDLGSH